MRLGGTLLALAVLGCAGARPLDATDEDGSAGGAGRAEAGAGRLDGPSASRDAGPEDAARPADRPTAADGSPRDAARTDGPRPDARRDDGPAVPDGPRPPDAARPPDAPRPPDGPTMPRCNPMADFGAPTPIAALNSASSDGTPLFAPDGLTLYFASNRPGGMGDFDIYAATRSAPFAAWNAPALVPEVNSPSADYSATVTSDGLTLVFTSDRAGSVTLANLWMSSRATTAAVFGAPRIVLLSTNAEETDPAFILGGTYLMFASDRPGSAMLDLWMSLYNPSARTFGPALLVSGVNSASKEFGGSMTADSLTIAFDSNRNGAATGFDLFLARRATTTAAFDAPIALGALNSTAADKSAALSPDGCEIVFASSRLTGGGIDDLFYARRP